MTGKASCRCLLCQQPGRTQQAGHVHIVTASMHHARDLRGIGNLVGLLDRQGVHVRSQGYSRPRITQVTHHASYAYASTDVDAHGPELVGHCLGRAMLSKGKLGMAMKITACVYKYSTQFLSSFKH